CQEGARYQGRRGASMHWSPPSASSARLLGGEKRRGVISPRLSIDHRNAGMTWDRRKPTRFSSRVALFSDRDRRHAERRPDPRGSEPRPDDLAAHTADRRHETTDHLPEGLADPRSPRPLIVHLP